MNGWPRARAWTWALLGATLAAGCALGPDHQRPAVALPDHWREAQAAVPQATDGANTAALLDSRWWEAFGDARLRGLVDEALVANLDLQIARLRVQEYDARLQIDRAARYPELGYGVEAQRQRISQQRPVDLPLGVSPSQSAFKLSANVGWEIDLWGRVKRSNETALAELLSTDEARRGLMLSVAGSVSASYVQLLALDRQVQLVEAIADNRRRALDLVSQRFEGGAANGLAVAQAQAQLAAALTPLPDLKRQIGELENALCLLLGRIPGPIERSTLQGLKLPPVPSGLPSELLWRRPDLLAAEQDLIAANARIGVAKAAFFPTLSLTTVFGFASNELDTALNRSANFGEIGPSLLGTIFSGGRLTGNVRQAEAQQRQQLARYRLAVLSALRDVEDALASRARRMEQGSHLSDWLVASERFATLTRARHEGGVGTLIEVLDAEREALAVRSEQVQNQGDTIVALLSVFKAMGGGWMDAPELPQQDPDQGALAALERLR